MKGRALALLLLLVAALAILAGCNLLPRLGGSDPAGGRLAGTTAGVAGWQLPGPPGGRARLPDGFGLLRLVVQWPSGPGRDQRGYHAQLVPDSTGRIDLTIRSAATTVATASVMRPAGQATTSVSVAVRVGYNLSVLAEAFPDSGGPIARGTAAGIDILGGLTTSAAITMLPLYTPSFTAFDPNPAQVGATVTISGERLALAWAGTPSVALTGSGGASVSAPVASFSASAITFTVPSGAASGSVEVKVDGVPSRSTVPLAVLAP